MAYIGSTPTSQNFIAGTDYFNGTGSQTAFTLTRSVNSVNDIEVTINNVVQQPNSYTVSGTTLTISAAPSAGTSNVYVRYLSTTLQSITVPNNSITFGKLDTDLQAEIQGRNRIINGHMVVDQRNAGASVATPNGYTLDRWQVLQSTTGKISTQQNQGSITPPAGFNTYLGITSGSSYSVGAGDFYLLLQNIEGFNVADLGYGTANAKTVTISFKVYSSLTGTFGGALTNGAGTRSYPFTYTVSSANTWTTANVTITGDTSGTWGKTNAVGMQLIFGLGVGSTSSGTAGAWSGSTFYSATGATSVVGTNGATFYITGVQLEEGTTATSFEREAYSVTLQKCQRYFSKSFATETAPVNGLASPFRSICAGYSSDNAWTIYIPYVVTMRTTPTMTIYSGDTGATAGQPATYDGGTWTSVTSNSVLSVYNNGFGISLVRAGGFNNQATRLVMFNYTASAEL